MILDSAIEIESLLLNGLVGFVSGTTDPAITGLDAPNGTWYIQNNGTLRIKSGAGTTDWVPGGGSDAPLVFINTGASVYVVGPTTVVLVDSTVNPVTLQLPSVASYGGRQFHCKWVTGKNKVTLLPSGTDTIDGAAMQKLGSVGDSLMVLATNNFKWVIL